MSLGNNLVQSPSAAANHHHYNPSSSATSSSSGNNNNNGAVLSPSASAFRPYNTNNAGGNLSSSGGGSGDHAGVMGGPQGGVNAGMMINGGVGILKSPSIGSEISARIAASNNPNELNSAARQQQVNSNVAGVSGVDISGSGVVGRLGGHPGAGMSPSPSGEFSTSSTLPSGQSPSSAYPPQSRLTFSPTPLVGAPLGGGGGGGVGGRQGGVPVLPPGAAGASGGGVNVGGVNVGGGGSGRFSALRPLPGSLPSNSPNSAVYRLSQGSPVNQHQMNVRFNTSLVSTSGIYKYGSDTRVNNKRKRKEKKRARGRGRSEMWAEAETRDITLPHYSITDQ